MSVLKVTKFRAMFYSMLAVALSANEIIQVNSFSTPTPKLARFQHNPRIKTARTKTTSLWIKQDKEVETKNNVEMDEAPIFDSMDFPSLFNKPSAPNDSNKKGNSIFPRMGQIFNLSFNDIIFMVENQSRRTRLVENRAYSNKGLIEDDSLTPIGQLAPSSNDIKDTFWMSVPAALLSFIVPFFSFPFLVQILDYYVTIDATPIDATTLKNVASEFGPGVSILYGTFVSITLSLLYQRQEDIQDIVAKESSLLAMITRNLLSLFKQESDLIVDAGQCVADQVRTLSSSSRGEELMTIMYNDPYARLMALVETIEDRWMDLSAAKEETFGRGDLLDKTRGTIQNLYELRASRLSNEALTLPPTHFFILTSLTALILLGYTVDILPTVTFTESGAAVPSFESSLLFGLLCTIYVLFYNYASDLNDPFSGVFQIRRASIVSHLMQAKSLIMDHPMLRGRVTFKGSKEDK